MKEVWERMSSDFLFLIVTNLLNQCGFDVCLVDENLKHIEFIEDVVIS